MDLCTIPEIWSVCMGWLIKCRSTKELCLKKRSNYYYYGWIKNNTTITSCMLEILAFPSIFFIVEMVIYYWIKCKPVYNKDFL